MTKIPFQKILYKIQRNQIQTSPIRKKKDASATGNNTNILYPSYCHILYLLILRSNKHKRNTTFLLQHFKLKKKKKTLKGGMEREKMDKTKFLMKLHKKD